MKRALTLFIVTLLAVSLFGCKKKGTATMQTATATTTPTPTSTQTIGRNLTPTTTSKPTAKPTSINELNFLRGGNVEQTWETNQGYSGRINIQSWVGQRGTDMEIAHPANRSMKIKSVPNTSCIIPFQFTISNTTVSAEYKNTLHFSTACFLNTRVVEHSINYSSQSAWFSATTKASIINQDIHRIYTDTAKGFQTTWYGFIEVKDYYSPKHPEGDMDIILSIQDNPYFANKHFVISCGYGDNNFALLDCSARLKMVPQQKGIALIDG